MVKRNEPCPCGSGKKWKKCHGDPAKTPQSDQASIIEALQDGAKVNKELTIVQLIRPLATLIEEIKQFDLFSCIVAAAGLMTLAENHTKIFRLDTFILLVAAHGAGQQRPSIRDLERWLNRYIPQSTIRRLEDPPEDLAIGNVCTASGDMHTLNGDWSNPDYYLQDILDAIQTGPEQLNDLRAECRAILKLSTTIAAKRGYGRNEPGEIHDSTDVTIPETDVELWELSRHVVFDGGEIAAQGISESSLSPFAITLDSLRSQAPTQKIVAVRKNPILKFGDIYVVAFPTSIPMATVNRAVSVLAQRGYLSALETALRRGQGGRILREATSGVDTRDAETSILPTDEAPPSRFASQAAFRFDESKHLHIVFLHDDFSSVDRNGVDTIWKPTFREGLARHLESSALRLASLGQYSGGLTLIVVGGIARGMEIIPPVRLPDNWALQMWSCADLDRLIWTEPRWKLMLWKLSMQVMTFERLGVFFEAHGDENRYSMWAYSRYRLVSQGGLPSVPLNVAVNCGHIHDLRRDGRRRIDEHCIYRPDREDWERVRRINTHSYFKEDDHRRLYGAHGRVRPGVLEGAVETDQRAWWVDCRATVEERYQREYIYKLWETTLHWLERIAPTIDRLIPELPPGNRIIEVDVSGIAEHRAWGANDIRQIGPVRSIQSTVANGKIHIKLPMALIAMGQSPVNTAERLLVRALVDGAVQEAAVEDGEARIEEVIKAIAIRDEQRFMHAFEAKDNRDYLQEFDHEKPKLLNDEELTFAPIGIAQEAGIMVPTLVNGKEESNRLLNALVDAFWKRCEKRLQLVDRQSLIVRCITNNERLLQDLDNWQKTSRAVFSLHSDQEDVLRSTQSLKEKRERTQISHRVMVEMAVCTSPLTGGRKATEADVDYLGGQIMLLMALAAHSDAVRSGSADPRLEISVLGDCNLGDDLTQVMYPYLTSHFERSHASEIARYEDWFERGERGTKSETEVFGDHFVLSFTAEYGISPGRLAEMAVILAEDAIIQQSIVILREKQSFRELLAMHNFSATEIDGLFTSFVLGPRERWNSASAPFRDRDWFPWRYRRRLSLMARPIVDLGNSQVVYAPGFCEDSFRHVVMESYRGAFYTEYFQTSSMKGYVGTENARRGLAFNKSVGKLFEDAGWNVRTEVSMTELGAPSAEASGDVDVLAWKDDWVCLCECKELMFARTITEVCEQLTRFRGNAGDDLYKHLRRSSWIQTNPSALGRIVGPAVPRFRSMLVTSKIVPMQFVDTLAVEVVAADELLDSL